MAQPVVERSWTARIVAITPAYSGIVDITLGITDGTDTYEQHMAALAESTDEEITRSVRLVLRDIKPSLDATRNLDHLIGHEETV